MHKLAKNVQLLDISQELLRNYFLHEDGFEAPQGAVVGGGQRALVERFGNRAAFNVAHLKGVVLKLGAVGPHVLPCFAG